MSWALRAMVLINVEKHAGQLCSLEWITGRVLSRQDHVQAACDELVAAQLLQAREVDGQRCYGTHVGPDATVVTA